MQNPLEYMIDRAPNRVARGFHKIVMPLDADDRKSLFLKMEISRDRMSEICLGKVKPTADEVRRLLEATGKDLEEFLA